jgi:sortase (surface protein transpeptidase)
VTDVGVTEDLEFAVPEDPGLVGRWDGGARPGDGRGTVALAGHVTWRGVDGLLRRLDELAPGDEVWLLAPDGTGAVYVAQSVDLHSKQALPWQDMFRYDVAERLLLITCGGSVDPVTGIHDSNVVAHLTPAPR